MRFHCGISFKPKFNKFKWLIFGLLGLGALFFSNTLIVDASTNITPNSTEYYFRAVNLSNNQTDNGRWTYTPGDHDLMGNSGANYEFRRSGALVWFQQTSGNYYAQIEFYYNFLVDGPYHCRIYASDITNESCNIVKTDKDYNALVTKITVDFYWTTSSGYTEFYIYFDQDDYGYYRNVVVPNRTVLGYTFKSFIYNPSDSTIMIGQNNTIINQNETIINNQTEINESINDIKDDIGGVNDSINGVTDAITEEYDGSAGGHDFDLPNYDYPSTIQGFFNLPIDLLRTIVNNSDTCTPYQINLSSITQRWGGFDYTLTLPCLRAKLQSLLGVIYSVVDSLIAFYLFYNMAMYVLQIIDAITSGTDLFSYLYHGANNNSGDTGYGHYNRTTGEVVD